MTMTQLAIEYRTSATILSNRIGELHALRRTLVDGRERGNLATRIEMLSTMQREARELAVLMERYYDRGYRKSGKYTI